MEAIRLKTRVHCDTGVHWPENSAMYWLGPAFTIGSNTYSHCVIADHLEGSVAIATDERGDPRPEWKILANSANTKDHVEILAAMGYSDIYDEQ